jgi:hypothetical protein
LWFSRKPFSHLLVFPARIQWVHQMNAEAHLLILALSFVP